MFTECQRIKVNIFEKTRHNTIRSYCFHFVFNVTDNGPRKIILESLKQISEVDSKIEYRHNVLQIVGRL